VDQTGELVGLHGPPILKFLTRAYQLPWPADGYPVQVSAYANWAGAYSTEGRLLVVSSLDPGMQDDVALESVFHEAMHQWDEEIGRRLRTAGRNAGVGVADDLSHALIFYTAGEAVRHVLPAHVSYAEANGMWNRRLGRFKTPLDSAWKPWLSGAGTQERALDALVRLAAGGSVPSK
jgi:hypothetical protein